jgi:pyruvate formate lyase activating enzyme
MKTGAIRPLILEIKGNSLDDGPGIRSVVFFKGCPLSCVWCHNPESKRVQPEIGFDRRECVACGNCESVCKEKAVSKKFAYFIDRSRCTLCFACVDACPSGALSRVGREMTVKEIVGRVMIDKPFYETSGGGVTLSGGEPSMFVEFASELLRALKKRRVHTCIETCGLVYLKKFKDLLLPYLDLIYYDIKIIDEEVHRDFTGASNKIILSNFVKLCEYASSSGVTLLPRVPLIPGITDTRENLSNIAEFLSKSGVKTAALMQYNPLWHEKANKVGAEIRYHNSDWMEREQADLCKKAFNEAGIKIL